MSSLVQLPSHHVVIHHEDFTPEEQRFGIMLNEALEGNETGTLYEYMYKDPRRNPRQDGASLSDTLNNSPDYHVYHDSIAILHDYRAEWAAMVGEGKPYTEAGIGSGPALIKPKLIAEKLLPNVINANDQSAAYVDAAVQELRMWAYEAGLDTDIVGMNCSWLDRNVNWNKAKEGALFLQGSTFTNFERQAQIKILERFAEIVGPNGHVFVDFDTCKDIDSLRKSYGSAAQIAQRKRILHYAKEIFNPEGLRPDEWCWELEERVEGGRQSHTLIAEEPQSFSILGREHRNVSRLVISHRRSLDEAEFDETANRAGLKITGRFPGQQGMMFKSMRPN